MQTITVFELKLEEALTAIETTLRKLRKNWLAKLFLPEYYLFFGENFTDLLRLIDDTLSLIATSERPLQRTELLSQALIEGGLRAQQITLIQTMSNQGKIARELSSIWRGDEEKMLDIGDNLLEFNQSLRDLEHVREEAGPKLWMDWLSFPKIESFPQTISPRLIKELLDPDIQLPTKRTVTNLQPQRMARHNSTEPAWPSQNRRQRR